MGDGHTEVVGVILLKEDGSALFQHRDDKPGLRLRDQWVFPGGHRERGEQVEDCARREFEEETAYRCSNLNYLGNTVETVEGESFLLHLYYTLYDGEQECICGEGQEVRFVPREDFSSYKIPRYLLQYWDEAISAVTDGRRD